MRFMTIEGGKVLVLGINKEPVWRKCHLLTWLSLKASDCLLLRIPAKFFLQLCRCFQDQPPFNQLPETGTSSAFQSLMDGRHALLCFSVFYFCQIEWGCCFLFIKNKRQTAKASKQTNNTGELELNYLQGKKTVIFTRNKFQLEQKCRSASCI